MRFLLHHLPFMVSAVVLALFGTFTTATQAAEPAVRLTRKAETVEVTIGGEAFAVYNFSKERPKPFFSPVRGPGGTIMTRPIEKKGDDHRHHKGIWVAVDQVNKIEFWAERGKIGNVSVTLLAEPLAANVSAFWAKAVARYTQLGGHSLVNFKASGAKPGQMQVVNHWLGKDGQPVVTETTLIGIYPNRLLTYDITFTAGSQPVTFGDTKEGLFGFRMVDSMRETEGGHVENAEGQTGSKACWGKNSDWIDYHGEIDGKRFGVAIFDHPKNFRRSRYHVRNYGLFSISPFGEKAYTSGAQPAKPLNLDPGESFRLRYAMYIHAGDTKTADVAGVYQAYVKGTR